MSPPRYNRELFEAHQTLGAGFVKRYLRARPQFRHHRDDLLQEALIGIFHASCRFDGTRGVQFKTFAWSWIRSYVSRYVAKLTRYRASMRELEGFPDDLEESAKRSEEVLDADLLYKNVTGLRGALESFPRRKGKRGWTGATRPPEHVEFFFNAIRLDNVSAAAKLAGFSRQRGIVLFKSIKADMETLKGTVIK